jgi:hypothetical protein
MFSVPQKAARRVSISRDTCRARVVVDPACAEACCTGTGRSPLRSPPVVAGTLSGRPEAVADDERDGEVGPARSSGEASEQGGLGRCAARGAKGRGQGECGPAKHGPDAEPGSRVTSQARTREAVIRNRQDKLTDIDVLRASFFGLKKTAAPGVDEMTWTEYAEHLEANLLDLHTR